MKPAQIFVTLFAVVSVVAAVAWGVLTIPKYLAQKDYEKKIADVRADEAAKVKKGAEPEFYRVNPYEPLSKTSGPQPRVEIKETAHEFGRLVLGETGKHAFVVTNVGDAPLKIAKGPMECKCTIPALEKNELPPGESTELIVEFTPTAEGLFTRHNDFWTNDPDRPLITVAVQADVIGNLVILPYAGWSLGTLASDREVSLEATLNAPLNDGFKILGVETSTPALSFEWKEDQLPVPNSPETMKGYRFNGKLRTKQEAGPFSESLVIRTDFPGKETITLPVSGSVKGPIQIFGTYFIAADRRFNLGLVKTGKEQRFKFPLLVTPEAEDFKLLEVKSVPEFMKLELRKEGASSESARYVLEVIVPKDAPSGEWAGATSGEILVKTNYQNLQELRFKLSLTTAPGN